MASGISIGATWWASFRNGPSCVYSTSHNLCTHVSNFSNVANFPTHWKKSQFVAFQINGSTIVETTGVQSLVVVPLRNNEIFLTFMTTWKPPSITLTSPQWLYRSSVRFFGSASQLDFTMLLTWLRLGLLSMKWWNCLHVMHKRVLY